MNMPNTTTQGANSACYYTGRTENWRTADNPAVLPESVGVHLMAPQNYIPDDGLVSAVNVALMLGQPLLLTGDPGTGKTLLAYNVASELGYAEPLKFEVKSTSLSTDLFYSFDNLRRFRDAQTDQLANASSYLTLNALGQAIVLGSDEENSHRLWSWTAHNQGLQHTGFPGIRRSVVLIDEIDKAPRDFPNDVLSEIEGFYFKIPELNYLRIGCRGDMTPVVIITSNSERNLPDAFLRRCVYYHINFPEPPQLRRILEARVPHLSANDELITSAVDLANSIRKRVPYKKPGTSEMIFWVYHLHQRGFQPHQSLLKGLTADQRDILEQSLNILLKTKEDRIEGHHVLRLTIDG